ncbi:MAG: HDIG domain-containing protein [Acidobacteria bacterium]|nr:HDIG domain-containing protein [Acidobacteriota bacterium]
MRSRRKHRSSGGIERALQVRAGWWDRIMDQAVIWAGLTILLCGWLVMPRTVGRLPNWKPGEVAAFDVVVQRDVAVPDEKATKRLRKEARSAVPPVYDLDPRVQEETKDGIRALFALCADELKVGAFSRDELAATSQLDLGKSMANILESSGCSQELEGALLRIVAQVYDRHIIDDKRRIERRGSSGITIRNLQGGAERPADASDLAATIDLRTELDPTIRSAVLEEDAVRRRWIKPLTGFLVANLTADLVYDRAETARRVEKAAAAVAPRFQKLKRGQVLVRRGDTVSPEVAAVLEELQAQRLEVTSYASMGGTVAIVLLIVLGWSQVVRRFVQGGDWKVRLSTIMMLTIVFTAVDRLGLFVAEAAALNSQSPLISSAQVLLWGLPHAAGPAAALMLLGLPLAVLFAVSQALLVGLMLGGSLVMVIFAMATGLVAVLLTERYRDRAMLTRAGLGVGVAGAILVGILQLYRGLPDSPVETAVASVTALLAGPVAMGIATFVLPIFEGIFGVTTDLRLLELSNQNLPLLKRLSLEAPGTYQHSLAVGNLAEAGAAAVGANGLLLRVCAYYHDVGKLAMPGYFVENQRGTNPHDQLKPSMSVSIIKNHIREGLELAREAKLPLPVRQAIATHHGTKLIRFFYAKAREEAREGEEVRESDFRYPGPKPFTKELGILLLADAVEAASRTLENPGPNKIRAMVERIVEDAREDGQLEDTELTFKELEQVSSAFLLVLSNMFHSRIDYPGFDFNRKKEQRDSGIHRVGTKKPAPAG